MIQLFRESVPQGSAPAGRYAYGRRQGPSGTGSFCDEGVTPAGIKAQAAGFSLMSKPVRLVFSFCCRMNRLRLFIIAGKSN